MSDKTLILEIPDELLQRAQAAKINVQKTLIEALERKIQLADVTLFPPQPSQAEIEAAITASQARVALGGPNLRVLGLHAGSAWISDDFDDELPDEFWFGDHA